MTASYRALLAVFTASTLSMGAVGTAQAEAQFTTGPGNASASLNFKIVIPAVMRLLENSHPQQLTVGPDGRSSGQQRLVVMSNLKRGICITLRRPPGTEGQWQLRQLDNSPVYLQAVSHGYKVCTTRPGRYTLELEHQFTPSAPQSPAAGANTFASLPWPVQTDINAI